MKRKPLPPPPTRVPANTNLWSESSQGSVAASFTKEYVDEPYQCWHCKSHEIFTALDQKHAYEVRKANVNQQRILCGTCWRESHRIAKELEALAQLWGESKTTVKVDKIFLTKWLQLLELQETYIPNWQDVARKNMLRKLLDAGV